MNFGNNTALKYELEKLSNILSKLVIQDEYLTKFEAAEFLKVSHTFFWKKEIQEKIPHIKIGNLLRFKKSDLINYLESGYRKPGPIVVNFKKKQNNDR